MHGRGSSKLRQNYVVGLALRELRSDELVGNGEGVEQSRNLRTQSDEYRLLLLVELREPHWTDESRLDDRLAESLDLADREELAEIHEQRLDLSHSFPSDGLDEGVDCEINAVQLGELLQSRAHLVVEDVHFSLALTLVAQPGSDHSEDVLDAFEKDGTKLLCLPAFPSEELGVAESRELLDVLDAFGEWLALGEETEVALEDVSGCLDVHDCVFPFVGVVGQMLVEDLRHS